MTIALSLPRQSPASRLAPGLLLTAGIVVAAFTLRQVPALSMFSPLILAVVLGVGLRNALGLPAAALPGMQFALRRLLRLGIVTLGLQLTLSQIAEVGLTGVAIIVTGLCATFGFTTLAGRALGVPANLTRLIATGTSVCGASAVLAAHAVGGKSDEDVAYAIACVTLFGTAAMLVFPLLGQGLDPRAYGLWTGASIHEVAQVVAAGAQHGPEAAAFATISKLTRVALLAPLILLMARAQGSESRAPFPLFVLGFLVLVLVASSGLVPASVTAASVPLTQGLLAMGLAAMGLQTDVRRLAARGLRPLALGALASVFIAGLTLALVLIAA